MKDSFIVQFVCFTTNTRVNDFIREWDQYAKRYLDKPREFTLQQQFFTRSRFNYVSRHYWPIDDFQFSFMNKKRSDFFHEQHVKVIQAGGYVEVGKNYRPKTAANLQVVLAFIDHNETDLNYYEDPKHYSHLNKYQAFYENCLFGHVYEYFITEEHWPALLAALKCKKGNEAGLYRNCDVPSATEQILDTVRFK